MNIENNTLYAYRFLVISSWFFSGFVACFLAHWYFSTERGGKEQKVTLGTLIKFCVFGYVSLVVMFVFFIVEFLFMNWDRSIFTFKKGK